MFTRHSPRAVLAFVGAALVGLVTARLVATDLAALHARARDAGALVEVLVAARDLTLGETVAAEDLDTVLRHERHLPPGAMRSPDAGVGRTVAVPLLRGAFVTEGHLADRERAGLDGVVPPGMRAVRVIVDDGFRPEHGAVVDVLVSFDPGLVPVDSDPTVTVVEGALVVAVDGSPEIDGFDQHRVGVTLLTDVDGAHRLAFAAANGIVTLALAPPEEACCPKQSSTSSSGSSRD